MPVRREATLANSTCSCRCNLNAFVPSLCAATEAAAERNLNGESMSDTRNAGVSHGDILGATTGTTMPVPVARVGYNCQWDCAVPGQCHW